MSDDSGPDFNRISTDTIYLPEDPDAYGEIVGAVPIAQLEELAERWKETAELGEYTSGQFNKCADELRSIIADYRGDTNE